MFASIPFWFQGLQALTLDEPPTIIPIPQDDPERNALNISERVSDIRDGWLMSDIQMETYRVLYDGG